MRRPRLTDADWHIIRRALNDAMDERSSYADAWHKGTAEREQAEEQVKKYERVHQKLFGGKSARQEQLENDAALPTVSVFELAARIPAKDQ